jgi:hypothetical protein
MTVCSIYPTLFAVGFYSARIGPGKHPSLGFGAYDFTPSRQVSIHDRLLFDVIRFELHSHEVEKRVSGARIGPIEEGEYSVDPACARRATSSRRGGGRRHTSLTARASIDAGIEGLSEGRDYLLLAAA